MWNSTFKNDTNEFLYKTETVLLLSKTNLWLPKQKNQEIGKPGAWDYHTHTTMYKINNHQGPTVQHRELYSIVSDNLIWKKKSEENEYMIMHTWITLLYTWN